MGSPPNLASRSEVVSIYKCPQKFLGLFPPKCGEQKHQIFDHYSGDCRTRHRISLERNVALTNKNTRPSVNLQCVPYTLTYLPWPLTQKRLRSVSSLWPTLWTFSIFVIAGFPTQTPLNGFTMINLKWSYQRHVTYIQYGGLRRSHAIIAYV